MRITPESTRRPRAVDPDGEACDWRFAGEFGDAINAVRHRAREHGWACNNPGPGRPASDLCPRHLNTTTTSGANHDHAH